MAPLILPSGRQIELHEPSYGELIKVVSQSHESLEALLYAKFAVIVPGLTHDEIYALDRPDGFALQERVREIWDGRPEEADIPLGDGSTVLSAAYLQKITLRPSDGLASTEWQSWRDAWVGRLSNWSESAPTSEPSANGSAGAAPKVTADS